MVFCVLVLQDWEKSASLHQGLPPPDGKRRRRLAIRVYPLDVGYCMHAETFLRA